MTQSFNPYRPPGRHGDGDRYRFTAESLAHISPRQLMLAAWAAAISATVTLPAVGLWLYAESTASLALRAGAEVLDLATTVMAIYILVVFRRLLQVKSRFFEVDRLVSVMIFAVTFMIPVSVVSAFSPRGAELEHFLTAIWILFLVPFGIVSIVFGARLLRCADPVYGALKPFAHLSIASGVLMASVVLAVASFLPSLIADIYLAMLFFQATRELQAVATKSSLTA